MKTYIHPTRFPLDSEGATPLPTLKTTACSICGEQSAISREYEIAKFLIDSMCSGKSFSVAPVWVYQECGCLAPLHSQPALYLMAQNTGINGNTLANEITQTKKLSGNETKLRSYTQDDLDDDIRKYKAKHAKSYADMCDAIAKGLKGAKKNAQERFGRNAIVRA